MLRDLHPGLLVTASILLLAGFATGCSGGGGGSGSVVDPTPVTASFGPSGTAGDADTVRATGDAAGDLVSVQVVIGGPTTSADLYSFAFDLVLSDATVAEYVPGSAVAGTALTASGGQSLQVLAVQQGDRVTVGVTKLGGGAGNGVVDPDETAVVELAFRVLRAGATTLTFEGGPSALDSTGAPVGSVTFDAAAATLSGS